MGVLEDSLFVNADWSALVPAGSLEAAFGITPKDAKRRGLLPLEKGETLGEVEHLASGNLIPEAVEEAAADSSEATPVEPEPAAEPEAKEAPAPANKAARKPANKGSARKDIRR